MVRHRSAPRAKKAVVVAQAHSLMERPGRLWVWAAQAMSIPPPLAKRATPSHAQTTTRQISAHMRFVTRCPQAPTGAVNRDALATCRLRYAGNAESRCACVIAASLCRESGLAPEGSTMTCAVGEERCPSCEQLRRYATPVQHRPDGAQCSSWGKPATHRPDASPRTPLRGRTTKACTTLLRQAQL